jgi:hypothetical protein
MAFGVFIFAKRQPFSSTLRGTFRLLLSIHRCARPTWRTRTAINLLSSRCTSRRNRLTFCGSSSPNLAAVASLDLLQARFPSLQFDFPQVEFDLLTMHVPFEFERSPLKGQFATLDFRLPSWNKVPRCGLGDGLRHLADDLPGNLSFLLPISLPALKKAKNRGQEPLDDGRTCGPYDG